MSDIIDIEIVPHELSELQKAFNLLKRELKKVAKSAKYPAVVISAEALPKVAKALSLPEPEGDFIHYNGVSIVTKESGGAGLRAALEKQYTRMGEPIDF